MPKRNLACAWCELKAACPLISMSMWPFDWSAISTLALYHFDAMCQFSLGLVWHLVLNSQI